MKYKIIFLMFGLLVGCETYKHSNPFDPQYDGDKTKIISISSYKILEYGSGFNSKPVSLSRGAYTLLVSLKNTGKAVAKNVSGDFILNASSNYIQVKKTMDRLLWGEIPPPPFQNICEGIGYDQALEIIVSSNTPYGYQFDIILKMTDEENQSWVDTINLQVQSTNNIYAIDRYSISLFWEYPITIEYNLDVFLKNISSIQRQLRGDITTTDSNIKITGGSDKRYVLNPNEVGKSNFPYKFELPKSISRPYLTTFKLKIKDIFSGNIWEEDISVTIN